MAYRSGLDCDEEMPLVETRSAKGVMFGFEP